MTDPFADIPTGKPKGPSLQDPFADIPHVQKRLDKTVGKTITAGHANPLGSVMDALRAPQRGLQALETGANPVKAFMDPKQGERLTKGVKRGIGLQGAEDTGVLSGQDPLHKGLRGAADFGLDMVNDPVSWLPVGRIAELGVRGAKLIPGLAEGVERGAQAVVQSPVGRTIADTFHPDAYMRGLNPEGKAAFEKATNRSMEAVKARKEIEDAIVKQHAAEIRAGHMPPEVARLFEDKGAKPLPRLSSNAQPGSRWVDKMSRSKPGQSTMDAWKAYFTDPKSGELKFGPGTRPQEVISKLYQSRAPAFKTQTMDELRQGSSIFNSPESFRAGAPSPFTVKPDEIEPIQKRLEYSIEHKIKPESTNRLLGIARGLTHRGNQAFLANPIPHAGNLMDLAYNRYGLPTAAKGMLNAGRVATGTVGNGKLAQNIGELEQLGAKSQYGNIFDELGLTRVAGIPGTEKIAGAANKAIIPLEKISNAAQHRILNSTETGLRSAALDAERKSGKTGAAAAREIHNTFGTNAPNQISEGGAMIGAPFSKFHLQTAPGSVARTLATNPGRISNVLKAEQDLNPKHGPKYKSTVPGANSSRMLADPFHYFPSNLGPIGNMASPYGPLSEIQKGKVGAAVGDVAGRYIPQSELINALVEMARKKKGQAGESGLQDLLSSLGGGYWAKK